MKSLTGMVVFLLITTNSIFSIYKSMSEDETELSAHVELQFGEKTMRATLNKSKAALDFKAMLPLELMLEDFAQTEKISDLPNPLSTDGAPSGAEAKAGDIAYYSPWGNLAIFYKDFRYSEGLIILGSINGDITVLEESASARVIIRLVK